MKILVTGANGFIGRRLSEDLAKLGHAVYKHDVENGNIKNEGALDSYGDVDFVYHLAAKTFVPDSWVETHEYLGSNIMGTATVLEFCRKVSARLLLMSTYVYGVPQCLPVDENHPTKAVSPYHNSKLICEELCRFYSAHFGLNVTIFRPFNVFGYGQREEFLLPTVMKQIIDREKKTVQVYDLRPKRDFIYIDDLINALICALKPLYGLHVFNIGTGESISVEQVIKTIMQITGINKEYFEVGEERKGEVYDCYADISLANQELGFSPKYSFEQGIRAWLNDMPSNL